ncbi:MAG TPA: type VI secretion system tip protein TssI/VgrG [Pyrinomonadaceae bacterium]|jgi:type VI secretion system secreted protein VgrG
MATTQDGRLLSISTPLGKDFLLLKRMKASEGLSELFRIDVELLHEETGEGFEATPVDVEKILGKSVTLGITQRDGNTRMFNGIVSQFSQGTRDNRFSYYYATIVPSVWLLTQNVQSRIFQHISVPDILKKIFTGFEMIYEIQGTFHKRNYCVQYRESDFAFASRLMEEEGIYYYFEHAGGTHKMIIANTPQSHRACPGKNSIPCFVDVTRGAEDWVSSIATWRQDYQLQTGKITLWDHNFELPHKHLEAEKPSRFNVGGNQKLEIYEFPAGYGRKYDGIDRTGGERAGDLQNIFEDNQRTAQIRMEELDSQHQTANGIADCASMTAGFRFTLFNHPTKKLNANYILVNVTHEADQSPNYVANEEITGAYGNSFQCIAHGAGSPPFRPSQKTPKPTIQGSQTATVVGPPGEEIFTDKYGRVKVQFHWDREGKVDTDSSCWVRVAQGWAGNKWGTMFIPRIGMEAVVHFLEGDPDQPIITGTVYNPEAMPPYTLPDEKTKMTIKSNSSKGGAGFNEFRFEDKKGEEQIFMHGEKNLDIRIKNDAMETIKRDRHLVIDRDQFEKVKKDKHLIVGGNRNEKIGGALSIKIGTDAQVKTGTKFAVDAGTEVHLKAGVNATIEAGTSLTLKVGGNFINISPAGVAISGTMVLINSGGAAGSGSGASPETPKEAKEADTANPGDRIKSPQPAPPLPPKTYSTQAQALQNAAKNAAPFCAICGK